MMIDRAIIEIMSNKPHKIRKEWIQDRADKLKGFNTVNKNLKISLLIDRLNEKIQAKNVNKIINDDENLHSNCQLLFDFK